MEVINIVMNIHDAHSVTQSESDARFDRCHEQTIDCSVPLSVYVWDKSGLRLSGAR